MLEEQLNEDEVKPEEKTPIADKTEISDKGPEPTVIMTVGEQRPGHNLTEVSTSMVSLASAGSHPPDNNLAKVKIEYPKNWKKEKFYKDGDIKEVSRESANTFIEVGIAKLVEPAKTA